MVDPATLSDTELTAICNVRPSEKRIHWIGVGLAWAVWLVTVDLWSPIQKYGMAGVIGAILWLIVIFAIIMFCAGLPYHWRTGRYRKELLRRTDLPETDENLLAYISQRKAFDSADWVILLDAQCLPHGGRRFITLILEKDTSVSLRLTHQSFDIQYPAPSCESIPVSAETAVKIREQMNALAVDHPHFSPERVCKDGAPLRFIAHQPASGMTIRYAFNFGDVTEDQKQITIVALISTLFDAAFGEVVASESIHYEPVNNDGHERR